MTLVSVLKELALEAGKGAVGAIVRLVRRQGAGESSRPQPLTYKHIEHIRAQERASIEASKKARKDKP